MDFSFLNRVPAERGSDGRYWLERALPIIVLLGLINAGLNIKQSWDDWNAANMVGSVRLGQIASIEESSVKHGADTIGVLMQAVQAEAECRTLDQQFLESIQWRYRPLLGEVEIALIGNDAIPVITSHRHIVQLLGGANELVKLIGQRWKRGHMVPLDGGKSTAFFRRTTVRSRALNIVVVVPNSSVALLNRDLARTTVTALYGAEGSQIAVFPGNVPSRKRLEFAGLRPGPAPDLQYATWTGDGSERLVLRRKVDVQLEDEPLTVEVGFSTDAFLGAWRRSVLVSGLGLAIMTVLLAFGRATLRREKKLRERLRISGDAVNAVVMSLPLPVLLVDTNTGKISLSNESTKDVFGALAGKGELAARLFVDQTHCAAVLSDEGSAEPVPLLTRKGEVVFQVYCASIGNNEGSRHATVITMVDVSSHQTQLKALHSKANVDALTGLGNRHSFALMEAQMVAQLSYVTRPLAVLMIDIDFFKQVNDTYGHAGGDRVLASIAQQLEASLREHDSAFRLGGEEFCVVLWDTDADRARVVAERIRRLTQGTLVPLESGDVISVTCSVGGSLYLADEMNLHAALQRADTALYRAKHGGRNRVELNVDELNVDEAAAVVCNQITGNETKCNS